MLTKGHAGSWGWGLAGGGGGEHSKFKYKTVNETSNARSQQFSENPMSMRSHTKSVCKIW